jgi:hypothetical protein
MRSATKTSFWTPGRFAQCSSCFRHQPRPDGVCR